MGHLVCLLCLTILCGFTWSISNDKSSLPNIPIDEKATKELYQHWYDQAASGLLAAMANRMVEQLPSDERLSLEKCSQSAKSLKAHAKCLVPGMKRKITPSSVINKNSLKKNIVPMEATHPLQSRYKQTTSMSNTKINGVAKTTVLNYSKTRTEETKLHPIKPIREANHSDNAQKKLLMRSKPFFSSREKVSNDNQNTSRRKKRPTASSPPVHLQSSPPESSPPPASLHPVHLQISPPESSSPPASSPPDRFASAKRIRLSSTSQILSKLTQLNDVSRYKHRILRRQKRMSTKEAIQRHIRVRKRLQLGLRSHFQPKLKEKVSPGIEIARMLTAALKTIRNRKGQPDLSWKEVSKTLTAQRSKMHRRVHDRAYNRKIDRYIKAIGKGKQSRRPLASKFLENLDEYPKTVSHTSRKPNLRLKTASRSVEIVKHLVKLARIFTGNKHNTTKLLSPSFLSLIPKENSNKTSDILSPDLFSFHEQGIASLPQLFSSLSDEERDAWMNFIMEASGSTKILNERLQITQSKERGHVTRPQTEDLIFTKQNATETFGQTVKTVIEVWESLYASYSPEQHEQLKTKGYAFLTRAQLDQLYGPQGPYSSTELPFDLDHYDRMSNNDKESSLQDYVRHMSAADNFDIRLQDVINTPITLTPLVNAGAAVSMNVILSPLVLSPLVSSPSVLGPVTLSPLVFTPLILSPRVLGPLTLSPTVGSPIILSPLALNPLTLSPGVMSPLVLSPFVLSPLTLSPQVLSPVILSPFALSPLILNPWELSPVILSPFVLSPLILSPQDLFALVLSPRALSPLINSPLSNAAVVLSPSVLS